MAQRTKENFKSTKNSRYADNATGLITAANSRDMFEDAADSFAFAADAVTLDISIDVYFRIVEDFISPPTASVSLAAFNNGGGLGASPATSTFGVDNTEKASGVLACSTSTSTAGGSAISDITFTFTFGFGFQYVNAWRIALSALSDGTDTYTIRVGFLDSISATPTDGAYFRYTHSVNSGRWEAVTVSNSVETAEDTGITAEISIFHVFKIVANSDATQVDFYIDGTKTNDITTNIINDAARLTGKVLTIQKTAGATARIVYADYYELIATRTTAR